MVSRLPVFSGKRVGKRVAPEMVLPVFVAVVLFFALLVSYPWIVLTIGTVCYLACLPLGWRPIAATSARTWLLRRARRAPPTAVRARRQGEAPPLRPAPPSRLPTGPPGSIERAARGRRFPPMCNAPTRHHGPPARQDRADRRRRRRHRRRGRGGGRREGGSRSQPISRGSGHRSSPRRHRRGGLAARAGRWSIARTGVSTDSSMPRGSRCSPASRTPTTPPGGACSRSISTAPFSAASTRSLLKRGGGSIVNLSSISGIVGGHNLAAYNASKGGVRLLTKSVALHGARLKPPVRCNSVHPAFLEGPMVDDILRRPAGLRSRAARSRATSRWAPRPAGRGGGALRLSPLRRIALRHRCRIRHRRRPHRAVRPCVVSCADGAAFAAT